jgi:hypothetical protein
MAIVAMWSPVSTAELRTVNVVSGWFVAKAIDFVTRLLVLLLRLLRAA